jgi:hypothetical protein
VAIFNRRNAVVGWLTWSVGKRVLKKKAKGSVPAIDSDSKKPNKSAIALAAAGAVGVLAFWRKRSGGDSPPDSAEPGSPSEPGS